MTGPASSSPARLSSQDLIRLKKHLADGLARAVETEGVAAGERAAFIQKHIPDIYAQTRLNLPDQVRQQIFSQVLDDLGAWTFRLLDDPASEIMVNGPRRSTGAQGQLSDLAWPSIMMSMSCR
jgi:hypothetical protein